MMRGKRGTAGVLGTLVAAGLLVGTAGWARDLPDILKDKGLLSEREAAEARRGEAAPAHARSGYREGKGFYLETADGRWSTHLGARMQLRYTYREREERTDDSDFRVRRIKLVAQGHALDPRLTYKLQLELADGSAELQDAEMRYAPLPPLGLRLGQFKPPQGRQEETSSAKWQFVERSEANDFFNVGRDRGAELGGAVGDSWLVYRAGIFNGNGVNERSTDTNLMYAGRLEINPLGPFEYEEPDLAGIRRPLASVGGSTAFVAIGSEDVSVRVIRDAAGNEVDRQVSFRLSDDNDLLENFIIKGLGKDGLDRDVDLYVWTANGAFKYRGASAYAEGFFARSTIQGGGAAPAARGFYTQGGYFVVPACVELAAQYNWIDPDRDLAALIGTREIRVVRGAVSYYIWKHNLKVQADAAAISTRRVAKSTLDDVEARIQVQVAL